MTTTISIKSFSDEPLASESFEPLDWNEYVYPNASEKEAYNQFWFYCHVGDRPQVPHEIESTGVQIALNLKEKFDR